jgi:hypothetical protein
MITLNGKHFNAKVLCSGGSGDELAKLFFTITSTGQSDLLINQRNTSTLLSTILDGQLISGYFSTGFITCNNGVWNNNCRYFQWSLDGDKIGVTEINDKTTTGVGTCASKACNRTISDNEVNHITGLLVLELSKSSLDNIVTASRVDEIFQPPIVSIKRQSTANCVIESANINDLKSTDIDSMQSAGRNEWANMLSQDDSLLSLVAKGYDQTVGEFQGSNSCIIKNTPFLSLTCPAGYSQVDNSKCDKSTALREFASSGGLINTGASFLIDTEIINANIPVNSNFSFVFKIKSTALIGYDLEYEINILKESTPVYQSGPKTAYVSNSGLILVYVPSNIPVTQTGYSVNVTAKGFMADGNPVNYTLELSALYEIASVSTDNFVIVSSDTCAPYKNCVLTSEYICDSTGNECTARVINQAEYNLGIQKEVFNLNVNGVATEVTITADGTKFQARYETTNASKFVNNAWFTIKREYNCNKNTTKNSGFEKNDLSGAFNVIASSDYKDGVFSYTDSNGKRLGFDVDTNLNCLNALCTVETSSLSTDAFSDGELRNDGEPKTRWVSEVRACDVITDIDNPVCPLNEGDRLVIPCGCKPTSQTANAAKAISVFKMAGKLADSTVCSSQKKRE